MERNGKKNQGEYTVDLFHVLAFLWHRIWIVILAGALVAGAAFLYASYFQAPQYEAQVRLMVKNSTKAESEEIKYDLSLTASELSAAQSLVVTYKEILVGNTTMNQVISMLSENYDMGNTSYTAERLAKMIQVEPVEDTAILSITVTAGNAQNAAIIANCIAKVLPERVVDETIDLKPLAVVDWADEEVEKKVSPNEVSTAVKGGVAGVVVAVLILSIVAIVDSSIHDEEYLLKTYNYPVLARVPALTFSSQAKSEANDNKQTKKEAEGGAV